MAQEKDIRNVRDAYQNQFEEELKRLNPAQRKAVDHISGPVIVLAGPGTGKTQMLAARIGRILTDTDTQAFNILCLTFTDAGVHAMRDRLLQFIGPEAHRVHIYTFHSFCNKIIQENLEYFGKRYLEPLSELERIEILQELINDVPITHPLKKGKRNPYFYISALESLFKTIKMEGWDILNAVEKVKEYVSSLEQRPEFQYKRNYRQFKKGDLREAKVKEEQQKMTTLVAALKLFPEYEKRLEAKQRYDYEDMLLWVLNAFNNRPIMLRRYQEQYLYFLIDEYQDTNGAQNELLLQLVGFWENPNIFIVGDDDQSIYEFQGARLKNLRDLIESYKDSAQIFTLNQNYRSSQAVLDISGRLIDFNKKRIGHFYDDIDKKLLASLPSRQAFGPESIEIVAFPDKLHEEGTIVEKLKSLIAEKGSHLSVGVLYARHKQAESLSQLLEKSGIPFFTKKSRDVLLEPLIQQVLTMMRYFSLEKKAPLSGEHLLVEMLHFPFVKIHMADLATISYWLKQPERDHSFRQLLLKPQQLVKLPLETKEALIRFSHFLQDAMHSASALTLPLFVEKLVNKSGLLTYVVEHEDKAWLLQILYSFLQFIELEKQKKPNLSLDGILLIIDKMIQNRLPVRTQQNIDEHTGIHLLSAHSSKGLEFDHVFLVDCTQDYWEPSSTGSRGLFSIPDTLSYSGEEDAMEARRRLFYVSVTRAKTHLSIYYSKYNEKQKIRQRSRFVDELIEGSTIKVEEQSLSPEKYRAYQSLSLQSERPFSLQPTDQQLVKELLKGFRLSISSLNTYLRCPLSFYYEFVLSVPVATSEAAAYGTAMHNSLYGYFSKMQRNKSRQFPPVKVLTDIFTDELKRRAHAFSPEKFKFRMSQGVQHLKELHAKKNKHWHNEVWLEYNIRNVEINSVPVKGVIDKIELYPKGKASIIDYKTGFHAPEKTKSRSDRNPHGGLYWRQLLFYKILFEALPNHNHIVDEGRLLFVDPHPRNGFQEISFQFEMEDIQWMRELIRTTYSEIVKSTTFKSCDEKDCKWCRLVKDQLPPDSLVDEALIELDD